MKIRITGLKVLQGPDSDYDEEIDIEISRSNGSFGYNNPPFTVIQIEIEGNIYKFRSYDLIKSIQALE